VCCVVYDRLLGVIVVVALGGTAGAATTAHAGLGEAKKLASSAKGAARPGDKAPRKPAAPLPAAALAELRTQLAGADENAALAAARKLGESGARNAAEPLTEVLAMGTTPTVAVEALAALGKLRAPKAIQVLTLYAGNRNEPVRKAAVDALGLLPDQRVSGVLMERLGDSASEVRAAAATALAARREDRAAPRLFKLVAKNDPGAAAPLGTLIAANDVPRLAELRGRIDDAVLASALGEFLKRPDVADRLRIDVVRTLARIPGAAATTALVEYLASIPEKDGRASKEETQKTVDARGGQ
jgi:HEAT repeat protein